MSSLGVWLDGAIMVVDEAVGVTSSGRPSAALRLFFEDDSPSTAMVENISDKRH